MFRENVLTKDQVIDRLASTMICVAVDRWKADDPTTREARFLRPFLDKHPPTGSPCIYAPDGTVLGGFRGYGDMAGKTLALVAEALGRFGPVEPRKVKAIETHPYRGRGVMSDGSVQLAAYVRPSGDSHPFLHTRTPVITSVGLGRSQVAAFLPARIEVGTKWTLPDDVARRFARITSPLCYQHAPQPDWVTATRFTGEVVSVVDGTVRLRYEARIASEHRLPGQIVSVQSARLLGEGLYDARTRSLGSIALVGSGTLRWPEAPEKPLAFEVLVEWTSRSDLAGPDTSAARERRPTVR